MTTFKWPEDQNITLAMPKELLAKWLAALRSGEYRQGQDLLYNGDSDEQGQYCCLGVLCEIGGTLKKGASEPLPSPRDYEAMGVYIRNGESLNIEPEEGFDDPYLFDPKAGELHSASTFNDTLNRSFTQIADIVERSSIGY